MSAEIPISFGYGDEDGEWLAEQQQRSRAVEREALMSAFSTAFSSPQGELVLAYLYDFCRLGLSTYQPGDSHQTAFNEGKRRVMLQIMGFIELDQQELFSKADKYAQSREGE